MPIKKHHNSEAMIWTICVDYQLKSNDALDVLNTLCLTKGFSNYIRIDNGSELIFHSLQKWLKDLRGETAYIEPEFP